MTSRLRPRSLCGLPVALFLLAGRPFLSDAQEPLRDNRASGRVEVLKVTTLQFQGAAVAPDLETVVIRLPDGTWGAMSRVFGGIVPLFSAGGSHVGTLGHPGPGPGEFKSPRVAVGVGRQLWVVDPGNNRLTAFGPDGTPVGDRTLPGQVLWAQPTTDGEGLLLSGFFGDASGNRSTTARVTMTEPDDRFGGDAGTSTDPWVQHHVAAETSLGEIWSVAQSGGDLQILRADNLRRMALSHLPEDLSQPEHHAVDLRTERPPPQVYGAMTDSDGTLWIVLSVADAHWRLEAGADPRDHMEDIFDTLVLAVSPQNRTIVAVKRMGPLCLPAVDALISCANEEAETIDVFRLRLER